MSSFREIRSASDAKNRHSLRNWLCFVIRASRAQRKQNKHPYEIGLRIGYDSSKPSRTQWRKTNGAKIVTRSGIGYVSKSAPSRAQRKQNKHPYEIGLRIGYDSPKPSRTGWRK
jgi:hypothetical protein